MKDIIHYKNIQGIGIILDIMYSRGENTGELPPDSKS